MTLTSPKMETLRFSEICASKEWHYIVVEDSTPQKSGDNAQLRSGVLAGEFKSHLCEARNRTTNWHLQRQLWWMQLYFYVFVALLYICQF